MQNLTELIRTALAEDLGDDGDITTLATVDADASGSARIIAKAEGVVAGGFVVEKVFSFVAPELNVDVLAEDGSTVTPGQTLISIRGPQRGILTGERTALNFYGRMSGIATLTARFVEAVRETGATILDTRKTNPGMRALEKYAVRMGGGKNHRIGLFDMMLVKENHIVAAGGIKPAVERCRAYLQANNLTRKIEVETKNPDEVEAALALAVDRIMLDNMSIDEIQKAVQIVNHHIELEVSGGVTLESVRRVAETGVDFISVGQLTHSPDALDISLLME